MKIKLLGKNLEELKKVVADEGLPGFTAKQIAQWLYVKKVRSIDEMTNLSKAARAALNEKYEVGLVEYADLHGGPAHPGDLAPDHDHLVLVSAVEEGQVVHGSGGHVAHGVALRHDAGHLVDPLHQDAAEETARAVEVVGTDDVDRLGPGIVHGLGDEFHREAPFVVCLC